MNGLMREHILLPGLRWKLASPQQADDPPLAPFTASHDLLCDGRLVLLPTPGHAPGSLSLLVRRTGGAPPLMVGDLTVDVHLMERAGPVAWRGRQSSKTAAGGQHAYRRA